MHKRTLSSIPEIEDEEELDRKWVAKSRHDILKAKYKCLKKLFQIYDASVIGILPEPNPENVVEPKGNRRRKRSHRTKTDACSGTNGPSSETSENENSIDSPAILGDMNFDNRKQSHHSLDVKATEYTVNSNDCNESKCECRCCNSKENQLQPNYPQLFSIYEKRKLTRFQCFVQRLFGIRREFDYPPQELRVASDPTLMYRKRKRRGLRFRRIKRTKKTKSESALKDMQSPSIFSYVQTVQRNCLMDTTPRQCPIFGCNMIFYGIINYNDHLNLSHFNDRKFICHYCHEGFEHENDKLEHENEHIGISKFTKTTSPYTGQTKIASDTQTEPETRIPDEKLKKIVSFFEKMSDGGQGLSVMKKNHSEVLTSKTKSCDESNRSVDTRTYSCCNIQRKSSAKLAASSESDDSRRSATPLTCHSCGETFNFRSQLNHHVHLEHRVRDKCKKHHRCAGIMSSPRSAMITEDGSIKVESAVSKTGSFLAGNLSSTPTECSLKWHSEESINCDPSTNIVYCNSLESLRKSSMVDSLVKKVRRYRWEPGTKIIRV